MEARYRFHQGRLADDDILQVVEQALASLVGEPVDMQVVLARGGRRQSRQVESSRSPIYPWRWPRIQSCDRRCRTWEQ